ncbi:hypothetical protein DBR43_10740 [Pedobacter sp. KBW06]|uniref:hypothetical protein n=1 Tax=Pedobacter sp. KBW06 TaxID=2153359 RepID=UPI000F5A2AFF|nr:hypothetical protein [Pedobacter sp. KBW06]RQO71718.1 hypothetical protein DBR43_10740 [Pedobacter sp. KBW06]
MKKHTSTIIILLFFSLSSYAQKYILSNEEVILSFTTKNNKRVVLAKDKANAYMIYRFGTAQKIEFEFPEKTKESWSKFTYSFYFRGGGAKNEGMDLNYIHFNNKGYKYTVYDKTPETGITITNLKTNKETEIEGKPKTRKGNLLDFRNNGLLKITE